MEENSGENIGDQPKIKIKRTRRRLYQAEAAEKKPKKKPPKVMEAKVEPEVSASEKPPKETDRFIISDNREVKAKKIIKKNMYWSAGIGLLPFPVFDTAALVALQVKMVREISSVYGIPFQESCGKSFILSLMGGLNVFTLSWISWRSFIKIIPGIAGIMGAASSSVFSGAATYAVGKVFIQHYEMGGTLLNFNPDEVKQYFREQYKQGIHKARDGMVE